MESEQCRQAMPKLHLSYQQFCFPLKCVLYQRFDATCLITEWITMPFRRCRFRTKGLCPMRVGVHHVGAEDIFILSKMNFPSLFGNNVALLSIGYRKSFVKYDKYDRTVVIKLRRENAREESEEYARSHDGTLTAVSSQADRIKSKSHNKHLDLALDGEMCGAFVSLKYTNRSNTPVCYTCQHLAPGSNSTTAIITVYKKPEETSCMADNISPGLLNDNSHHTPKWTGGVSDHGCI